MKKFFLWNWITQVDRILRGDATKTSDLREGKIDIPIFGVAIVLGVLGLVAGACTGVFSLASHWFFAETQSAAEFERAYSQFAASTVKVPLLFLLTLIVTFPSLYVFNALVGSKLRFTSVLRLLTAAMAVTMSVLAAIGPIVAFFSVCTDSYHFMVLLNVTAFGLAGVLGMLFLLQTLNRLCSSQRAVALYDRTVGKPTPPGPPIPTASLVSAPPLRSENNPPPFGEVELNPEAAYSQRPLPPGPLDPIDGQPFAGQVKQVFAVWMIIFGLVGSQMAWVLRPFIGAPGTPFSWFRERDSNFFAAVFETIQKLMGL